MLLALLVLGATPAVVLAARSWSIVPTPTALVSGVPTTVSLAVTNTGGNGGGDEMTCVRVTVPPSFTVTGASILSVRSQPVGPAISAWQVVWPGGGFVVFKNPADNYPLVGSTPPVDRAVFTITGVAAAPGPMTWSSQAFDKAGSSGTTNCGSGQFPTVQMTFSVTGLAPSPTVAPTPQPTPRPTPQPTPKPTPKPTPAPTPLPLPVPLPSLPVPLPSVGPPPAPGSEPTRPPTTPAPSPTPGPTSSDRPPAPPGTPVDEDSAPVAPPSSGSSGGTGASAPVANDPPTVAFDEQQLDLGSMDVDLLGGVEIWSVPAATLGVPGILLIIWVGLQAVGALAWIPAVRRLRGDGEPDPS
jgi:hypothetical protein